MYDVIVIGAGVIGCAVARELSKFRLKTAVLEKEDDVCSGTSKANSGLVHAGFDAKPGTIKAKMNVEGASMMEELCAKLDVPYRRTGALVLATNEDELPILERLLNQGHENKVKDLEILNKEEVMALEPMVSRETVAALYAKTAAIVCPFALTIAMAENANVNGVEFFFETTVNKIEIENNVEGNTYYQIHTMSSDGTIMTYEAKSVVNCAGVYSDEIHNMVSNRKYHITPRRGEYCLLDKNVGTHVSRTVFHVPGKLGKGILVTPTVHGNLLLGPTAEDIQDKDDDGTTQAGLDQVLQNAGKSVRDIPVREVITSFAGLRAHEDGGDFILGEVLDAPGFMDAVGIESPGLSSAPAIGKYLTEAIVNYLKPEQKQDFIALRKGIVSLLSLSEKEQQKLIKVKPEYGQIVCRCEMVTEGEILDAIYRPLGARSLDAIKRRTRAGMGRCQSGFCSPKVLQLLAEALKTDPENITKKGSGTSVLAGHNKNL